MKEKPPYSVAEIRVLLSQYLDGALDAEQVVEAETLLARYPDYQAELLKLQATRAAIQDCTLRQAEGQLHFSKASDAVWKNISHQLESDAVAEPLACDPEFISAYYDGEIPATDPAFQIFEGQLYHNEEANRLLADVGAVSEAVRQFGYRMENDCTFDCTQQVMAALLAEQDATHAELADEAPMDAMVETISAFVDQELPAKEIIEANKLIEGNPDARRMLGHFNGLSEHIQAISHQLQEQVPDFWPQVKTKLAQEPAEGKIIPLNRRPGLRGMLRVAVPVAAAAVLVILALPALQLGSSKPSQDLAYKAQASRSEIASVPMNTVGNGMMAADGASPQVQDAMYRAPAAPDAQTLQPELEPAHKLASDPEIGPQPTETGKKKTPSSEEYLFHALNEQMPDEDISTILGK